MFQPLPTGRGAAGSFSPQRTLFTLVRPGQRRNCHGPSAGSRPGTQGRRQLADLALVLQRCTHAGGPLARRELGPYHPGARHTAERLEIQCRATHTQYDGDGHAQVPHAAIMSSSLTRPPTNAPQRVTLLCDHTFTPAATRTSRSSCTGCCAAYRACELSRSRSNRSPRAWPRGRRAPPPA